MRIKTRCLPASVMSLLIGALIGATNLLVAPAALAQSACETLFKEAEKKFNEGDFNSAMASLNRCLKQSAVSQQDKLAAYKFLAEIHIAKGDIEPAKETFRKMLQLNPQLTFDPDNERREVMKIFTEVKNEPPQQQPAEQPTPPKKGGSKKKWIIGGGAAAAGAITAILILSGRDEGFPDPPVRPPR